MGKVAPELQKKIHRLMYLKYRKHKKIANLSLACIFLYSILVFLILTHFCTIEFEISEISRIFLIIFSVVILVFLLSASHFLNKLLFSITLMILSFGMALTIGFVGLYDNSVSHLLLLFLGISVCFFILCFVNKRSVSRDNFLLIYFIFFFIFLWPVVEVSIEGVPIVAKIGKILFSISPFLMLLFRSSFTDFLGSGYLIRRWFKIKDSEVWNCPGCHGYILKKPIRFCPHCGNDSWALDSHSLIHLCKNCGSFMKIKEIDFPNFCPHCGLAFKFKHPRTYF